MKHYSELEWLTFKNKSVNNTDFELMENHLLECDDCLNMFLNLSNDAHLEQSNTSIPPNFSQTTMLYIRHDQFHSFPAKRPNKISRLLSYYVVAALITLMLVSSGMFQAAVSNTDWINANSAISLEKTDNIIFNWPSRLIDTSSTWTNSIQKKLDF